MDLNHIKAYRRSNALYQTIVRDFMTLFYNDKEEIELLIKRQFKDKPFTAETLERLYIVHRDEVNKILNRLTAGIYTPRPSRELELKDASTMEELSGQEDIYDENLERVLEECDYNNTVIDAYKKGKYLNTVIAHPVWREGELQIDILTGDSVMVKTKTDFYQIEQIKIQRANSEGEIYYSVWNENEHYTEDGVGNRLRSEDNPDGVNPYIQKAKELNISSMPFVVLRFVKGYDFWGEPNWSLYDHQLLTDINLSDNIQGEFLQKFPILVGIDTELPQGTKLSPGNFVSIKPKTVDGTASLSFLQPNTDWANIRENETSRRANLMNSMGIPEGSASVDGSSPKQVGSKTIDELELHENREMDKAILEAFELKLLEVVRMVNNTYETRKDYILSETGRFDFSWSEEKLSDDVDTLIKRREFQIKYGIKTPIDFIMDDWEVSQEEAQAIYEANKAYVNTGKGRTESLLEKLNANRRTEA